MKTPSTGHPFPADSLWGASTAAHQIEGPDDAERTLTGWEHRPEAIRRARRHTAAIIGDVPLDRH